MTAIRLEHAGGAAATTITASISDTDLTILLADATGWPTGGVGPFVCTINAGEDDEEKIKVTSRASTTLTVATRGFDSTTAVAHSSGAAITHTYSATEADEANVAAVAIVAATGGLVGRTQTQTLTGKTVDLASNTLTGTLAQFNTAVSNADLASLAGAEALSNKTVTGPSVAVTAASAASTPLTAKGAGSQSANLQEWQDSTAAVKLRVSSAGVLAGAQADALAIDPNDGVVYAKNQGAGIVPIIAKGYAAQSANLQEWQNSDGTVLASVDKDGDLEAQDATVNGDLVVDGSVTATGIPLAMAAGFVDVTVSAAISGTAAITFPASRFSVAPLVMLTVVDNPDAANYFAGLTVVPTTSGATVHVTNYKDFSTSLTVRVHWVAIQMVSGSASG